MGIREALNKNPAVTSAAAVLIIIAAVGGAIYHSVVGSDEAKAERGPQAYFSDDDGKTVFRDDPNRLPPFDHHGREAVAAFVLAKDDGADVVLYLSRYTAAGKELKAHPKPNALDDPAFRSPGLLAETEVKRPGDKEWVKMNDPRSRKIMEYKPG